MFYPGLSFRISQSKQQRRKHLYESSNDSLYKAQQHASICNKYQSRALEVSKNSDSKPNTKLDLQ